MVINEEDWKIGGSAAGMKLCITVCKAIGRSLRQAAPLIPEPRRGRHYDHLTPAGFTHLFAMCTVSCAALAYGYA